MFGVSVQAAIGPRVIAQNNGNALRKNPCEVLRGDMTGRRKLLERQREGKKRMKQVGTAEIPQEAFLAILEVGEA